MIKCGIDLGGTNIKFGFFKGNILINNFSVKTPKESELIVETIINNIKNNYDLKEIEKYSVCIPGVINNDIVVLAPNTNIVGLNLSKILKDGLENNNIIIENDANLAALAEARATKTRDLVLITLGTGVGGGIVINNELYNKNGFAGEIGHMKVEFGPFARKCACGCYGCVECYCSAKNMPIEYNIKNHTRLNSKQLFDLYEKNNKDAIKNVEHFARYLGILIANINQVLAINEFRIGGGLSHASNLFLDKVYKYYKMNVINNLKETCNIRRAKLDSSAGIYAVLYI